MRATWLLCTSLFLLLACASTQALVGVRTDRLNYKTGEPIEITVSIVNHTGRQMVMEFASGMRYDIWVERNGRELWRWSRERAFIQVLGTLSIGPGETKRFTETWDQKGNNGRQIPPGSYQVRARIVSRDNPPAVSAPFAVKLALTGRSATVAQILAKPDSYKHTTLLVRGKSRGWRPYPGCAACKAGPPVTRSDWVLADGTRCVYVYGSSGIATGSGYGRSLIVQATVARTPKGQVYLKAKGVMEDPDALR